MDDGVQMIPNTFGVRATADKMLEYHSEEELLGWVKDGSLHEPVFHIGVGSNLLFIGHYAGTILHSAIKGIQVIHEDADEVEVRVGAGEVWDDFVDYCVKQGWYGAENLTAIPGEVGAAAVQNIGAYGVEAKDLISMVETIDVRGVKRCFAPHECGYAYRSSIFKQADMKSVFVTYVRFKLKKHRSFQLDYGTIRQELSAYPEITLELVRKVIADIRWRKLPHPEEWGNAGSFFMNPIIDNTQFETLRKNYPDVPNYKVDAHHVKIPAGWLIEQCGWKGKALGRAAVYSKQALVLVNLGGATGAEIGALSDAVCQDVYRKFDISIKPEVNILGQKQ